MGAPFYETDAALAEYLLFHYGSAGAVLPYSFGPSDALDFPVRAVAATLDWDRIPQDARALDLGCAVGRSTFEMARRCAEVVGIDASERFIETAEEMARAGGLTFRFPTEGALTELIRVGVDPAIDRSRARFEPGDAQKLRPDLGSFDVVLMANLIDRLREPRTCLGQLPALVRGGGQLVITSPYTWLEGHTPRENWLGGFQRDGNEVKTFETLGEVLAPAFELVRRLDLPFLIREHARKYQWSIAEATVWVRRRP